MSNNIDFADLKNVLIEQNPFIDVRAPIEFELGHLPGAINLPILTNFEREQVGITYKKQGQEAAIKLGQALVSGEIKNERIASWKTYIENHPRAVIYCFRGGLRSQTTQTWLKEINIECPLMIGGYKRARRFLISLIEELSQKKKFLVISGRTGSGKTTLLHAAQKFYPTLDLEALANHRGSAFGNMKTAQPSQSNFENSLATKLLQLDTTYDQKIKILLEDESRMIGKNTQPEILFHKLRESEVIWLEENLETRVENIMSEYLGDMTHSDNLFQSFEKAIQAISRKLGGAQTAEILKDLSFSRAEFQANQNLASNQVWIRKLLVYYYDPLYLNSLERRNPKIIFKGTRKEALEMIQKL